LLTAECQLLIASLSRGIYHVPFPKTQSFRRISYVPRVIFVFVQIVLVGHVHRCAAGRRGFGPAAWKEI
jgi:hypothetical protein